MERWASVDFHHGHPGTQTFAHKLPAPANQGTQAGATVVHMGRIYRIVYGENPPVPTTLAGLSSAQLVEKLGSPEWLGLKTRRNDCWVERANPDVITAQGAKLFSCRRSCVTQNHTGVDARWHGTNGQGNTNRPLSSPAPKVLGHSHTAAGTIFRKRPQAEEFFKHLIPMADTDLDPDVQLQLAFTFGQTARPESSINADWWLVASHSAVAPAGAGEAIITSLYQHESEFIEMLAREWKLTSDSGRARALLQGVFRRNASSIRGAPICITQLLDSARCAAALGKWQQVAMLDGMDARGCARTRRRFISPPSRKAWHKCSGQTNSPAAAPRQIGPFIDMAGAARLRPSAVRSAVDRR